MGKESVVKSIGNFFWELIKAFLIAMAIIVPIRYYLVQPFFVRGASMEPSFDDGEYLVIDQLSFRFRQPERGEVIVFRFPGKPSQFFIKRIVGLPGERVRVEDGRVIIHNSFYPNGVVLDESSYLDKDVRSGGHVDYELSPSDFFMMGDNRPASSDSRSWGPLGRDYIIGRAWIRAFPFNRVEVFGLEMLGFLSL